MRKTLKLFRPSRLFYRANVRELLNFALNLVKNKNPNLSKHTRII